MITMLHAVLACVLVLGALVAPCLADVIVMDVNGGGDHTDLQVAINAAVDGDTLLVRPGVYVSAFSSNGNHVVGDKALTIVADDGGTVEMARITVDGLAAGKSFVLRGVTVRTPLGHNPQKPWAVWLRFNDGHVWVEDCILEPAEGTFCASIGWADDPGDPARIEYCQSVSFIRCQMIGERGKQGYWGGGSNVCLAGNGGNGAWILESNVSFHNCTLWGGEGGLPDPSLGGPGGDGGHGVYVGRYNNQPSPSTVFLSGCDLAGGVEGLPGTPSAGDPGDGLHVTTDAASVEYIHCTFTGSPNGQALNAPPGTLHPYTGAARHFAISSPLREQQAGVLSIAGQQGDFVGFFWAFDGGSWSRPAWHGWFLLDTSLYVGPFLVGPITSPDGMLTIPILAPDLFQPTLEAQTFLLQAVVKGNGGIYLGPGTAFTLVDSSF